MLECSPLSPPPPLKPHCMVMIYTTTFNTKGEEVVVGQADNKVDMINQSHFSSTLIEIKGVLLLRSGHYLQKLANASLRVFNDPFL